MPTDNETKMLNIGCGVWFHPDWINIDLRGGADVICHNITEGLPFSDESFDVVYHSHLLEHIPRIKALPFMKECYRVLKPGGIVRVLVPDLEQIARLYLEKLVTARKCEAEYDWIMLELYDQCVRYESGGFMEHYLRNAYADLSPFTASRIGASALQYDDKAKGKPSIVTFCWRDLVRLLNKFRQQIAGWSVYAIAGGKARDAFMHGLFRNSGEIHCWMYDRFSLGRLMANAGFADIRVVSLFESSIPDFARYELDVVNDIMRKPDSLVMEGVKP